VPAKALPIDNIENVWLTKRKGSRSLRISLKPDGKVVVNAPWWVTQSQVIEYVSSKREWIAKNRSTTQLLVNNQQIGKAHRLQFVESASQRASSRIVAGTIKIFAPKGSFSSPTVQKVIKSAAKRALMAEASNLLPQRLETVSRQFGVPYRSVAIKHHKTRWGVCDAHKNIVLNCFLMNAPWPVIDYVIVHELAHTKVMAHSTQFWDTVADMLPNYKKLKTELKTYRTSY
jgi:predicted metal-dependent hydrolase